MPPESFGSTLSLATAAGTVMAVHNNPRRNRMGRYVVIGLSDRLLVMLRGRIVAEVDPAAVTPADLGSYMTGATTGAH